MPDLVDGGSRPIAGTNFFLVIAMHLNLMIAMHSNLVIVMHSNLVIVAH